MSSKFEAVISILKNIGDSDEKDRSALISQVVELQKSLKEIQDIAVRLDSDSTRLIIRICEESLVYNEMTGL